MVEIKTIGGDDGYSVLTFHISGKIGYFFRIGVPAVQNDDKRLAQGGEFLHYLLLGLDVTLPRQVHDTAVGCDYDTDGRVIGDDFLGTQLRRLDKRDRLLVPRSPHRPRLIALHVPYRAFNGIPRAINHPYVQREAVAYVHRHGIFWNELGLDGCYRAPRARLWHGIDGPLSVVFAGQVGKHEEFHELTDEGGFPDTHGTYYANVDIAVCAPGDIHEDIEFLHLSYLLTWLSELFICQAASQLDRSNQIS